MAVTTADKLFAANVEFANRVQTDIQSLVRLVSAGELIVVPAGSTQYIYTGEFHQASQPASEGADIPLGTFTGNEVPVVIDPKLYRKAATYKSIQKFGFDQAVSKTDNAMADEIYGDIATSVVAGMTQSGQPTATGATFKAALAAGIGKLKAAGRKKVTPIAFVNPEDFYAYLGGNTAEVQTAFGMDYIEGYLGCIVVSDPSVAANAMFVTATENINVFAAEPENGIEGIYTDETGLVAVSHNFMPASGNVETFASCGVVLVPEYVALVVKSTIAAA